MRFSFFPFLLLSFFLPFIYIYMYFYLRVFALYFLLPAAAAQLESVN